MNLFNGINDNSSVLVTGGTGSFGKKFIEHVLSNFPKIKRLVVYSRDELKQHEMSLTFSTKDYPGLRYFIGDIRDQSRLSRALEDIEVVIHAAALKQVPAAEYNPFEFIKTNIIGAQNVIESSLNGRVKRVVALSTDKAAAPINLYGATKLCSDKLFVAANNVKGRNDIIFSVVRYGNVAGSRGSVIPLFLKMKDTGIIPITSTEMTRFNITLQQGVSIVLWAIKKALGGEIFVPKIPSYRILDLASAVAPTAKLEIIGLRPGEKIHEEMITTSDSRRTIDIGDSYIILPDLADSDVQKYITHYGGKLVGSNFSYTSEKNPNFLSIDDLQNLVKEYI